jgi:hypothetical protein
MSQEIILSSFKPPIDSAIDLTEKFIEVCPDELWTEKSGGWPVWLHLAHALWASDFFVPGESSPLLEGLTLDQIRLVEPVGQPAPKKAVLTQLQTVRTRISSFLQKLDDADLPKANEKIANFGWTLGRTLTVLASHPLYHLGYCDAVLRDHGLSSVF